MSNAKEIKRKIRSVQSTGKITKAMELISTVKMRKAQQLALSKKEFVVEVLKIFLRIQDSLDDHPFFKAPTSDSKTLWVIVTSNKWLCGGYNINVMKEVRDFLSDTSAGMDFVAIWKRGANFIAKTGNNLIADYSQTVTDNVTPMMMKSISRDISQRFLDWEYGRVVIFYNHYINTIRQVAVAKDFLPISPDDIKNYLVNILDGEIDVEKLEKDIKDTQDYAVEPDKRTVVEEIIPMILDMMMYDFLLEAKASEHSARMIAMRNAKDNAKKIASNLQRKYNKARQAMITKEVAEIVSWTEALADT